MNSTAAFYAKTILPVFMLVWVQTISAQTFVLDNEASSLQVKGSSTLHDWDMQAQQMQGTFTLEFENDSIKSIRELRLSVVAESLKSGKSGLDRDAYEALETDKYGTIDYEFEAIDSMNCKQSTCELLISGYLNVSGTRKLIETSLKAEISEDRIILSGNKPLKMTDYGIEPPKVFFGLLKAQEEVDIVYELVFKRNE